MSNLENMYDSHGVSAPATAGLQTNSSDNDALTPIVLGVLALIVGWFIFGIPLCIAAISFGRKAVAAGSKFGGRLLLVAAWTELILTIWFVFLAPL